MPPISSTHSLLHRDVTRGAGAGQSRYTYLFPALAEEPMAGCFAGTTAKQTFDRLRQFETACRAPLSDMPRLQMKLPAAYTYFGQFVNHDISAPVGDVVSQRRAAVPSGMIGAVDPPGLDRAHRATTRIILANLVNEHAEPLTLASLYGDGPDSADPFIAALYEDDRKRFRLASTRREADRFFTDRLIDPARVVHATGARDIPRRDRLPLIADHRNDENLVISQLHLALMLLHNKAVAALEAMHPDPLDCFRQARQLVTLHYHWLILHDYLPSLLSRSVLARSLADWQPRLKDPNHVPLEFTTAAFRFGHSMVGSAYNFNDNFGIGGAISDTGATLEELFEFTSQQNMQTSDPQTLQLPDHWVVDWDRMTRLPSGRAGQRRLGAAEPIDINFAPDMLSIVGTSQVAAHGSILFRNLMRGYHRRIPFGQRLAQACQVPPLSEDEVRQALPDAAVPGTQGLREAAEEMGLLTETPAWLYFLCEAVTREGGHRVGPTASHIIADTIVGLLRTNPRSVLNHPGGSWHPRKSALCPPGTDGLTSLRRLLTFAVADTASPA